MTNHFNSLRSLVIAAPHRRDSVIAHEPDLSRPSLPGSILSTLRPNTEPEEVMNSNRLIAVHLGTALESQGLSLHGLLRKLAWSNRNKNFRHIDAASNGESCQEFSSDGSSNASASLKAAIWKSSRYLPLSPPARTGGHLRYLRGKF